MSHAPTRRMHQRHHKSLTHPETDAQTHTASIAAPSEDASVAALEAPITAERSAETHWPIIGVFSVFLASLFLIPTLANVPVGDDWVYTRSVEILVQHGRIEILDLSVVTLVAQVFWGGLFSFFDVSFASTRVSTIAIVLLSGAAMYALCRDVGISRQRSALGTALYLFNPLTFGLSFSFMTDPHFTAWLVIATWLYVRGLRPEQMSPRTIVLGSAVAALAFLVRQQGLLVPFAVGLYLLAARRWRPNLDGIRMAIWVAGIPALTMVVYFAWLFQFHGAPEQQSAFLDQMVDAGFSDSRILIGRMTFIEVAYIGLFVLPVTLAALPMIRSLRLPPTRAGRIFVGIWLVIAGAGYLIFAGRDRYMPFIPQYAGFQGIGPTDLQGGRPRIIDIGFAPWLTVIVLVSTVLFALTLAQRLFARTAPDRSSASLLVMIALWQVAGVLPPSFHFRNWIISVDRYLLPLLPLAVVLLLWALRDARMLQPVAWTAVAVFAAFSIIGTRDFLVFQDTTWDMAHQAIESGVSITALDAGASWDGYHLYEYSMEHGITQQTPSGPWWTNLFGPATNSTYVVSTQALPGYEIVDVSTYSSWMDGDRHEMLLLRKLDAAHLP